jgi:hypothetical protein
LAVVVVEVSMDVMNDQGERIQTKMMRKTTMVDEEIMKPL